MDITYNICISGLPLIIIFKYIFFFSVSKLLRIAADYDRVKQQNVELQLAYDQRTREASYMREQMANLLLEIQPLRSVKVSRLVFLFCFSISC